MLQTIRITFGMQMAILSRMYPCKECADHFKEVLRYTASLFLLVTFSPHLNSFVYPILYHFSSSSLSFRISPFCYKQFFKRVYHLIYLV